MFRSIRNLSRLWAIARVLARYDVLGIVDMPQARFAAKMLRVGRFGKLPGRIGQRLALALTELGPTFIKLGQTLSTRADLLGAEAAADLSGLQDNLPPFPFAQVRAIIEAEFEQPLESLFASFDEVPVAAASIAQVHFATTLDGREVAVKVLRPGVEAAFQKDIQLVRWLAEWVERTQPRLRRLRPIETVKTFEDSVRLEMDLRFEAAAAAELAENFRGDEQLSVPAIDWLRTSRQVMTQERVIGIKVDEIQKLQDAGLDVDEILQRVADCFYKMVLRDGFFHADLHPGNLFVQPDGKIVPIDFGIMGRIDIQTRRFMGELMLGFITGDYRKVAEVHFAAGFVPADQSLDNFTQACRSIAEPIMGKPMHEVSVAKLLGQLFQITEQFSMQTQPQLLLLQKSMLMIEGVGRTLNPKANLWEVSQPLVQRWMHENLGVSAKVKDYAGQLVQSIERLPRMLAQAEKATAEMMSSGIKLHPDSVKSMQLETGRRRSFSGMMPWVLCAILAALLLLD